MLSFVSNLHNFIFVHKAIIGFVLTDDVPICTLAQYLDCVTKTKGMELIYFSTIQNRNSLLYFAVHFVYVNSLNTISIYHQTFVQTYFYLTRVCHLKPNRQQMH